MKNIKGRMDESILVCVYYGPNGERLIRRGSKLANILNCPLYVLTVDHLPYDEFDAEKSGYIERWKELANESNVTDFLLYDNDKRPIAKVIAEVARKYNITQIIIGQTPQNRWEEITKGSFINVLLREISFIDIHIVSNDRTLKSEDDDIEYERGVRAFLHKEGDHYLLGFTSAKENRLEGIFYKEVGTDFNNGIFKYPYHNKTVQVQIKDNVVVDRTKLPPECR